MDLKELDYIVTVANEGSISRAAEKLFMAQSSLSQAVRLFEQDLGTPIFVRYCRVGAGDAIGDVTGCELVCMLVGERPGLVTDKSMSAYITYRPRTGVFATRSSSLLSWQGSRKLSSLARALIRSMLFHVAMISAYRPGGVML